jgi:hypothetical protein
MTNRETFKAEYKKQLKIAREKYPDLYLCPMTEFDAVFDRMTVAIEKGSFNKDSHAFKATCKALKIKHTYRDIEMFLGTQGGTQ